MQDGVAFDAGIPCGIGQVINEHLHPSPHRCRHLDARVRHRQMAWCEHMLVLRTAAGWQSATHSAENSAAP